MYNFYGENQHIHFFANIKIDCKVIHKRQTKKIS
jgi:hypothetical protein